MPPLAKTKPCPSVPADRRITSMICPSCDAALSLQSTLLEAAVVPALQRRSCRHRHSAADLEEHTLMFARDCLSPYSVPCTVSMCPDSSSASRSIVAELSVFR